MMDDVINVKPVFDSIEKTNAVFQDSDITYNEAGLTYNESGQVYGGSDRIQSQAPEMFSVAEPITITVYLYEGMSMGLLLALTYPETESYRVI